MGGIGIRAHQRAGLKSLENKVGACAPYVRFWGLDSATPYNEASFGRVCLPCRDTVGDKCVFSIIYLSGKVVKVFVCESER